MRQFVLLKADVTKNDAADRALEKYLGVVAPPTFVFFNKKGNELQRYRSVGEIKLQPFVKHLNKILKEVSASR